MACVSNDQGEQRLFSSVPVEADRQRQQLNAVWRDLGATPTTPVTVLSDGDEGARFLGETASPGPTRHVLDWFHLSMRVQHVTQTARSWPRGTKEDLQHGDLLAKTIDRIRWRLWHGRPQGALDLIAEILEELETPKPPNPANRSLHQKAHRRFAGSRYIGLRAIQFDYQLCRRTAFWRANLDGADRERGP